MKGNSLVSRSWNGTPISRRTTDGYVNATAMCKANGKAWASYWRTDRATNYLEALSSNMQKSILGPEGLVISLQGGDHSGTWVHERVAVDLARWLSPQFAVWMDGWFLEEVAAGRVSQVREPQPESRPALGAQETMDIIERGFNLLERLGVVDERDCLQFGDMIRNVTARSAGGLLLPSAAVDPELTLSDAWLEVFQEALPRKKYKSAGRLVAQAFRQEFGKEPPVRQQFVDGAPRQVKSYKRSWLLRTLEGFKARLCEA